jgi:crotonobetainyl-CoA:carnitine CoA-transferase CaiB-like acyl-CoA transferase
MSDVPRRPLALEGIKVVDFTISAVGPLMTKALADYGAQVVKVESVHGRELIRVSAPFKDGIVGMDRSLIYAWTNTNKYSVALNLNHSRPRGDKRLVAWETSSLKNMTPGQWRNGD